MLIDVLDMTFCFIAIQLKRHVAGSLNVMTSFFFIKHVDECPHGVANASSSRAVDVHIHIETERSSG